VCVYVPCHFDNKIEEQKKECVDCKVYVFLYSTCLRNECMYVCTYVRTCMSEESRFADLLNARRRSQTPSRKLLLCCRGNTPARPASFDIVRVCVCFPRWSGIWGVRSGYKSCYYCTGEHLFWSVSFGHP